MWKNWTRGNNYKRDWTEPAHMLWHLQRMAEGKLPTILLKWMPKQKSAGVKSKENWMEGIKKAINERNLNVGQWKDSKHWIIGVGPRRKRFWTRYIHTHKVFGYFVRLEIFEKNGCFLSMNWEHLYEFTECLSRFELKSTEEEI